MVIYTNRRRKIISSNYHSVCLFGGLFKLMCKKVVKEFMSMLSNQQIDALCCICKDIYLNSSDRNRDVNRDDQ